MNYFDILLAQKTGYIPRNHFDALFARRIGGAVLKDFPGLPSSIVTVTDAAAMPLDSLKVAITPVQKGSGDPSPDNIRPISGWTECNVSVTGANVWDEEWEIGTINLNTGELVPNNTCIRSKNFINVASNSYVYNFVTGSGNDLLRAIFYDAHGNFITSKSQSAITNNVMYIPDNCHKMKFYCASTYGTTYNNNISINYPSTDTSYHAYTGTTYPITFPSEAGTVYGGTLDVVNGVLTVTMAEVDLGALTWQAATGNAYFYSTGIGSNSENPAKKAASNATPANMICEQYKNVSRNTLVTGSGDCEIAINSSSLLQLKDARFAEYTPSDVQTAVTGIKMVYELETPQTYQLTPTEVQMLLGINNIWADTGDILEGKYWGKKSSATRAMLSTLRSAGEVTPTEEPEELEGNDER